MKEYRTKVMSIKVRCACVNSEYFSNKYSDYYDLISWDLSESKRYGKHLKSYYVLKPFSDIKALGLDEDFYFDELPAYVCTSIIY